MLVSDSIQRKSQSMISSVFQKRSLYYVKRLINLARHNSFFSSPSSTRMASLATTGTPTPSAGTLIVGTDGTNARGIKTDSSGNVQVDLLTSSIIGPSEPTIDSYASVAINLTTGANQVLVASAANKQIWVYGYAFTCGDADGQTASLQDEDDAAITGIMEFSQYGGISVPLSGNFSMPVFKLATNKDLEIDITGGDLDGWLAYAIVSV